MTLGEWIRSGRLQYVTLWALAAVCVGFALADATLLGFDPATLAMLGAVFAASTSAYGAETKSRCETAYRRILGRSNGDG